MTLKDFFFYFTVSDFYPKLRDEYVKPYMQLDGGKYFPWKLLDLVPSRETFSRTAFPIIAANKKIDPMLFKVGIGKRNTGSVDPFLFKIGLGKKSVRRGGGGGGGDGEQLWQMKDRRKDIESFRNWFGTEEKPHVFLSSKNREDLNADNSDIFSDVNM